MRINKNSAYEKQINEFIENKTVGEIWNLIDGKNGYAE